MEEAPRVIVDPGQPIRVSAWFPPSKHILFSYLAPGEHLAVHDPGFGRPGSRIKNPEGRLHTFTIDTRRMKGGDGGWWYFSSEDEDIENQRARLGRFTVRGAPAALINRSLAPTQVPATPMLAREATIGDLEFLGSDLSEEKFPIGKAAVGVGVVAGFIVVAAAFA